MKDLHVQDNDINNIMYTLINLILELHFQFII
jgi:hypothetical protein